MTKLGSRQHTERAHAHLSSPQVNLALRTYYFDCVGMTDYMLRATPNARKSLRAAAKTKPGFIPSPWAHIHAFNSGPLPYWNKKTKVGDLRAGV
jgi:hypothetical protein